jgi:hypothetical protein
MASPLSSKLLIFLWFKTFCHIFTQFFPKARIYLYFTNFRSTKLLMRLFVFVLLWLCALQCTAQNRLDSIVGKYVQVPMWLDSDGWTNISETKRVTQADGSVRDETIHYEIAPLPRQFQPSPTLRLNRHHAIARSSSFMEATTIQYGRYRIKGDTIFATFTLSSNNSHFSPLTSDTIATQNQSTRPLPRPIKAVYIWQDGMLYEGSVNPGLGYQRRQ